MRALSWISARTDLALAGILLVAAATRGFQLSQPGRLYFDEFYAQDACVYLGWAQSICGQATESSWMHPPLGKWLISAGIALFGFEPIAWRLASACAGIAMVGLVYVLARRLTNSALGAGLASSLIALDPLSIESSRIAMLDIFAACAGVAAVLFVVLDAEAISPPPSRSRLVRPWLGAAGVAAGIAVATKWSGVLVVAVIVLLVLAREAAQVRRTGGPALSGLRTAMPTVIGYLIVLPAAVYVLSYAGRVPGELAALPWEEHAWIRAFVERQRDMLAFHTGLDATHPYASPAWSWLLGKRPVVYLLEPGDAGSVREILAFANPLIWVPGMVAAIAAGIAVIRKRMRWGPEVVIMAAVMGTYLPWVILATGRSQVFVYYILPTLPFLAVALGWAAAQLSPRVGRVVAGGLAAISVGVLIFWSPLIYGWPLDREAWRSRVIFTDCGEWTEMLTRPLPERPSGPPPPGWCWI